MIYAKRSSDGKMRLDALIFALHDLRHGELPPAKSVQQEKH